MAWWSPALAVLKSRVNKARNKAQDFCPCRAKLVYMGQHRRLRQAYKGEIKKSKKASWEAFVRDTANENVYSLPYKLAAEKLKTREVLFTLVNNRGQHIRPIT